MVDQTRRKLHIPNSFSPYLEKHRIYELFHEMVRELVVQQPLDHVLFLKEILYNAAVSRYAPRIIFISPPHINTFEVAKWLAEKCKANVVTEDDILNMVDKQGSCRPRARKLTNALHEILRQDNTYYTGWILPVEFEHLLCQAWISESYLGSKLRECRDKVGEHSLLLTSVIHKRILEKDCIDYGWVLTGFPSTIEDFKNLDMIDTPPNKVIFLDCDVSICRQRILHRKMNCYTGSVINVLEKAAHRSDSNYKTHPKDIEELFSQEIKYYCEHYEALRKYCGCTSVVVDANQGKQSVTETIQAIVMRPLPDCEPRVPCHSLLMTDRSDDQDQDDLQDLHSVSMDSCLCSPCVPQPRTPFTNL